MDTSMQCAGCYNEDMYKSRTEVKYLCQGKFLQAVALSCDLKDNQEQAV